MKTITEMSYAEMAQAQAALDTEAKVAKQRADDFRAEVLSRVVPVLPSKHEPGTVNYEAEGCKLSVINSETISWDSAALEEMQEAHPELQEFTRTKTEILKSQLKKMPPELANMALEAATIKPAKIKITIEEMD